MKDTAYNLIRESLSCLCCSGYPLGIQRPRIYHGLRSGLLIAPEPLGGCFSGASLHKLNLNAVPDRRIGNIDEGGPD